MPRKKQYYRKRRPQAYRKRRRYYRRRAGRATVRTVRTPTGIPDRIQVKMKYTQNVNLVDNVGGVDTLWTLRGNSLWDPDFTGTGGQPMGRDQWNNFYQQYRVNASKLKVQLLNNNSSIATGNCFAAIFPVAPDPPSSTEMTAYQRSERPYTRSRVLPTSGSGRPIYLSSYMSTKKIYGLKSVSYSPAYSQVMGGNPSSEWYWGIQITNLNGDIHNVIALITITYYVELFDRVELLTS